MSNSTPPLVTPDPCAVLADLRAAEITLATGKMIKRAGQTANQGSERQVEFQNSTLQEIRQLKAKYEIECAKSLGAPSKRFAISPTGSCSSGSRYNRFGF